MKFTAWHCSLIHYRLSYDLSTQKFEQSPHSPNSLCPSPPSAQIHSTSRFLLGFRKYYKIHFSPWHTAICLKAYMKSTQVRMQIQNIDSFCTERQMYLTRPGNKLRERVWHDNSSLYKLLPKCAHSFFKTHNVTVVTYKSKLWGNSMENLIF